MRSTRLLIEGLGRGSDCPPETLASFTSMLTGAYPHTHGIFKNGIAWPDSLVGLPVLLQDAGYDTVAFAASYVLVAELGMSRGFDHYDDTLDEPIPDLPEIPLVRDGADVTDAALRWFGERGKSKKPFFAMIHYFDPHAPYHPAPPFDTGYGPPYEGPGRFLEGMDSLDLTDETLIIVTSDHGEGLLEHADYFNHGLTVYESNIRIPFIAVGPGVEGADRVIRAPTSNIDVAATLVEYAGLPASPLSEGQSFLSLLSGDQPGSEWAERYLFAEATKPLSAEKGQAWPNMLKPRCVVQGDTKVIHAPRLTHTPIRKHFQLYQLGTDPSEKSDLWADLGETTAVTEMVRRLTEWSTIIPRGGVLPQMDPDAIERLKSLGY